MSCTLPRAVENPMSNSFSEMTMLQSANPNFTVYRDKGSSSDTDSSNDETPGLLYCDDTDTTDSDGTLFDNSAVSSPPASTQLFEDYVARAAFNGSPIRLSDQMMHRPSFFVLNNNNNNNTQAQQNGGATQAITQQVLQAHIQAPGKVAVRKQYDDAYECGSEYRLGEQHLFHDIFTPIVHRDHTHFWFPCKLFIPNGPKYAFMAMPKEQAIMHNVFDYKCEVFSDFALTPAVKVATLTDYKQRRKISLKNPEGGYITVRDLVLGLRMIGGMIHCPPVPKSGWEISFVTSCFQ